MEIDHITAAKSVAFSSSKLSRGRFAIVDHVLTFGRANRGIVSLSLPPQPFAKGG